MFWIIFKVIFLLLFFKCLVIFGFFNVCVFVWIFKIILLIYFMDWVIFVFVFFMKYLFLFLVIWISWFFSVLDIFWYLFEWWCFKYLKIFDGIFFVLFIIILVRKKFLINFLLGLIRLLNEMIMIFCWLVKVINWRRFLKYFIVLKCFVCFFYILEFSK